MPLPLVVTKNTKNASTVLAFIGLWPAPDLPGSYSLRWQSGGTSVLRAVNFSTQPLKGYKNARRNLTSNNPLVVITGNGGGLWYNFYQEGARTGKEYRHLLVQNTTGPLRFYQLNPEHALSDANMEIRKASNISIYGLKGEGNTTVLKMSDTRNISVFGYGGNAAALPGEALFLVENSNTFLFANMVDTPRISNTKKTWKGFGKGVDPRLWHIMKEKTGKGSVFFSPPPLNVLFCIRGDVESLWMSVFGESALPM